MMHIDFEILSQRMFLILFFILIQEFLNSKLPPVPEEDDMFRNSTLSTNYSDLDLMTPINQMNEIGEDSTTIKNEQTSQLPQEEQEANMQNLQYTAKIYTQPQADSASVYRNSM